MDIVSLRNRYQEVVKPKLKTEFGLTNNMAVPRIAKVTVNIGVGKFLKEDSRLKEIQESLAVITGQKLMPRIARKAVASFKIREDMTIGYAATLRGEKMWSFLDRLVHTALPRVRDFQGIPIACVDQNGNLNMGLKEHAVFAEIIPEKVQTMFGFQIIITTTAQNAKEAEALFRGLGFPLQTEKA